jgi:trehalose 6-phosphate phosphatase
MNWDEGTSTLETGIRSPRFGLITDVDGTISPIGDEPDAARVTPGNLELLARLGALLPLVAVISGRSAGDVARRVNLPGLVYIGNHGMEQWQDGQVRIVPSAAAYREALTAAAAEIRQLLVKGMSLEDKGVTLSVHYRTTDRPEQVAVELTPAFEALAGAHGLRLTRGRMVFEFRPPVQVDKGSALVALVRSHRLEAAVYLGDDTTDVTAFQNAARLRASGQCLAYGLGVCSPGTPAEVLENADYLIQEVSGVETFLAWLLKARMASST